MPFTVLKISKAVENQVEVVGEFPNEDDANDFAEGAHSNDLGSEYDYIVERPPHEDN
jgi:hypothetical protein